MKNFITYVLFSLVLTWFPNAYGQHGQPHLLAGDYRIYEGTRAWNLAQAIKRENVVKIRQIITNDKTMLNVRDKRFSQTLLGMAVISTKYNSVKVLLELGANPNVFNGYDGLTPLMDAASIINNDFITDSRFLVILLKYGGNPNLKAKDLDYGSWYGHNALTQACYFGVLDYAKILINAGANINYKNESDGNKMPLDYAINSRKPDVVLYLLEHGADYKHLMIVKGNHKKKTIADILPYWNFDMGSDLYKQKLKVVAFFKRHGIN